MIHNLRNRCRWTAAGALTVLLSGMPLAAQETRDPTVEPGESAATGLLPKGVEGMSVLVRGDHSFLMVGTRLYAPGDSVGNMRVERITETEVWLHDGNTLIKVARFAGITRTAIAAKPLCMALTPAAVPHASPAGKPPKAKKRAKPNTPPLTPNPPDPAAACEDTPS